MDWWTLAMLAITFWFLYGMPALDEHYKRRSEARIKAWRDDMARLEEAIEEHHHWIVHGRGKPYRDIDVWREKILSGEVSYSPADLLTMLGRTT